MRLLFLFLISLSAASNFEIFNKDIIIDAQSIEYDPSNMCAAANGKVIVNYMHGQNNCRMECDKLICLFDSKGIPKKLIANDNVIVTILNKEGKSIIYCDNCEYRPDNKIIYCHNRVKILYKNHQIEGEDCSMDMESGIAAISHKFGSNPVIATLDLSSSAKK